MENRKKPLILAVSDLVAPTGFARVAHSIFDNLLDEFDVIGLGVNYMGDPHSYKYPIYPARTSFNPQDVYGYSRFLSIIDQHKPDIIWILNDPWIIDQYLRIIKDNIPEERRPKIVTYYPIDAEFPDTEWFANFDIVDTPVAYTEFGANQTQLATGGDIEPSIIPHGTDTNLFFPMDTKEARKRVYGETPWWSDEDVFIVLNANRNQPRKRLDMSLQGFALFAQDKPMGVKIHMHCGVVDAGFDIIKLARRYGIEKRLVLSNLNQGIQTVTVEHLNAIYNSADVGINTSMGEGWGLTNTEHAAAKVAQVVGNHSASAELFDDCGLLIEAPVPYTFDNIMTVGRIVSPVSLAKHLQTLYLQPKLRKELAEKAYKKFTQPRYSWEAISDLWAVVFEGALNVTNGKLAHNHEGDDSTDN